MPILNAASKVYKGTAPVTKVYRGSTLVWPPGTGNQPTASLGNLSGAVVRLTIGWTGANPESYGIWVSVNGGGWSFWFTGHNKGTHDYTAPWSSNVRMKVVFYYGGFDPDIERLTGTVTIGAAPPPPTGQFTVHCGVLWTASYNGNNVRRTDSEGLTRCYYGYYDGTHGVQKSIVRFNIPNDVRNCISVDAVQLRWWNQWHFKNSGGTVSMVGHHNINYSPGSTGRLLERNGHQVNWPAPKPGWINGTEWYHVGWLTAVPFNRTMAEEIRIGGLQGFGLVESVGGQAGYGYASTDPILSITYTKYT